MTGFQLSRPQTDAGYFRAASSEATKLGVAFVFRQGGQNDLGLAGMDPKPNQLKRRKSWELFGAPSFWNQDTIAQFLQTEGWKKTTIRTKKRKHGQGV